MGCCENRDKVAKTTMALQVETVAACIAEEAFYLNIRKAGLISDSKMLEILTHVHELEQRSDWVSVVKEKYCVGKKLDDSKFSSEYIVALLSININKSIPLEILLKLFLESKARLEWDSNLTKHEVHGENAWEKLIYMKVKVMFYTAEFVDKTIVTYHDNAVYIIWYSVSHEMFPEQKGLIRGFNILGCVKIHEDQGATQVTFINQCNPNSNVRIFAGSLGIVSQKAWIERLKRYALVKANF